METIATNCVFEFPYSQEYELVKLEKYKYGKNIDSIVIMLKTISPGSINYINTLLDILYTFPKNIPSYLLGMDIKCQEINGEGDEKFNEIIMKFINELLKRNKKIGVREQKTF